MVRLRHGHAVNFPVQLEQIRLADSFALVIPRRKYQNMSLRRKVYSRKMLKVAESMLKPHIEKLQPQFDKAFHDLVVWGTGSVEIAL